MAGAAGGFVTRAFESMLKECATNKKFAPLHKSIQSYLDNIKGIKKEPSATDTSVKTENEEDSSSTVENEKSIIETLASAGNTLEGTQAELVLQPLRLAFESKNIKLIDPALDCLHKLIAYNHLEGDPGVEGGKNAPLFTDILNMVCGCVDNTTLDSTILQVLKVLLTAVASNKFRVHGEPLLAVIKVCYDIALNSKSPINQATSKAMLTQMISIVFRRMESDQVQVPTSLDEKKDESSSSEAKKDSENKEISTTEKEKELKEEVTTLGDALSISNVTEATPASVEELQNLAGGADIKGLEAVLDKAVQLEDGKKVIRGIDLESLSIAHRDALLLFRTLCKMGMKEETDEVTTKTRLLSLELLQGLLEGVNGSFTKNFHFIDSVKAYLSYALLRASVSSSSVVFQYASAIFSVLLLRFRESLKGEIGVFFPLIVLRSLDSSDTPLTQRASVLRMLEKVCKDSQMLADLFVNYDCDLEAPNLYERMVNALSKIAQGTISADPNSVTATQANSVKGSSLQCLVSIIKSLVDWEKAKRETTKQSSVVQSFENEDVSSSSLKDRSTEEGLSHFEKAKAHKSTLESAVSEFNRKPSKGIEYLLSNKLVENTPSSIAQFLKNTPTLNKVMIGEYLGQHEEFPLAVMHAYVESMKFSGLKFDSAIREFLKGFRLPGEAQKIDRIMEKFAERYCADNPGLFKNADTAYVLAYAVIMLNTDAHNPMVWPKMSKSDFVRMNTVSDAEESAPTELLEEIYDSIVQQEIKMKDSDPNSNSDSSLPSSKGGIVNILNLALPRSKSSADTKAESERIVKQTQAIIKSQGGKRGVFYTAEQVELVRPMLEAVGWPLLATFSVTMEEGDSKPRVLLCMEGFKAGIHITWVLGMDTMRYAFLTSLIRFTFLHAPKQLRSKNSEALRTLLSLAGTEPDALQDTWNALLECISRLDHITSHPSVTQTVMQGSNQVSREAVVQVLRDLAGRPAEQVFVNSVKLRSGTIVEFFMALCSVSDEELKQSPARVFSLQKLVEISYYNMARIRLVWAQIWTVLARHFITAGSHPDEKVAMYAIDSLRQLGMKYLERAELNKFTFQNDILKPFVVLMRSSRNDKIRGLIVDCIVQLIKSKVGSIKSGWKSVFMIFTAASDDDQEPIVESAFENVEQVVLEHFDQVVGDCFMDCVHCLIGFANNKASVRISLKAVALLRICEDRLAEGLIPGGALKPLNPHPSDPPFDVTEHYWFPMLAGLSDLTLDPRAEVRSCAVEVLFDLLNERGRKFSPAFWESIFERVLFPIFDHVRGRGEGEGEGVGSAEGEDWVRESSVHSLQLVCNLFNTFYTEVSFMLPPLLGLLLDCAKKTDQTVVSIALGALVHLIEVGGHRFSDADWDTLLKSIRDALYTTQPLELLNSVGFEKLSGGDVSNSDAETSEVNINSSSPHSYQETTENSDGLPSPSAKTPTGAAAVSPRNPSFSQRFMDNILMRNLTSKSRVQAEETFPSSSQQELEVSEGEKTEEEEEVSPIMETVRSKCITQLLLLGAINSIQVKYWNKLKAPQKVAIMDVLMSLVEFAASYNSPSNLRIRMHHMSTERLPLNLLRQEISGTTIYLEILHKSTAEANSDEGLESDYEKIKGLAEEKLVTFCNNVLKEASDLQPSSGEASGFDIHRVLSLRAPIIVKVLKGMCLMDPDIFKRHLRDFYPLITKLICCDQMDVRGALGDLFTTQLTGLMPKHDTNNAVQAY